MPYSPLNPEALDGAARALYRIAEDSATTEAGGDVPWPEWDRLHDFSRGAWRSRAQQIFDAAQMVPRAERDEARGQLERLREAAQRLTKLILDDMSTATNQDLACDGPVPQGANSAEGKVWLRIEAEARSLAESGGDPE